MGRTKKKQISRAKRHLAVLCVTAAMSGTVLFCGCGQPSGAVQIVTQSPAPVQEETIPETVPALTQEETQAPALFVHICGQVKSPGVYELPQGSRVWDAVEAAGGFLEEAAEDSVNLASVLEDGIKIVIPSEEEAAENPYGLIGDGWYQPAQSQEETEDGTAGLVNINQATAAQLQTVPGIGEVRAQDIVAYREANGPFEDIEDIMQVSGIKEGLFAKIKDYITVGG